MARGSGATGLFERLRKLSVGYQTESREIDQTNLVVLIIRALARSLDRDTVTLSDTSDTLKGTPLKTKDIVEEIKNLIETEEININSEWITSPKISAKLSKLRFKRDREGGSGQRRWRVKAEIVRRLAKSYGLTEILTEGVSSAVSHVSQTVTVSQIDDADTWEASNAANA